MARPRKVTTGALALVEAGERVVRAERKVTAAEKSLAKAQRARTEANDEYIALAQESFRSRLNEPPPVAQEVTQQTGP